MQFRPLFPLLGPALRYRSRAGAVLIAAAALGGASPPAELTTLTVTVEGLRSQRGHVLACLTTNPHGFPDCSKDARALRLSVPGGQAATIVFENVPAGRYAIALLHDENDNGKPDMALFLPREGFGFSRDPAVRFGPPAFSRAAFTVSGASLRRSVRMRYMF